MVPFICVFDEEVDKRNGKTFPLRIWTIDCISVFLRCLHMKCTQEELDWKFEKWNLCVDSSSTILSRATCCTTTDLC